MPKSSVFITLVDTFVQPVRGKAFNEFKLTQLNTQKNLCKRKTWILWKLKITYRKITNVHENVPTIFDIIPSAGSTFFVPLFVFVTPFFFCNPYPTHTKKGLQRILRRLNRNTPPIRVSANKHNKKGICLSRHQTYDVLCCHIASDFNGKQRLEDLRYRNAQSMNDRV